MTRPPLGVFLLFVLSIRPSLGAAGISGFAGINPNAPNVLEITDIEPSPLAGQPPYFLCKNAKDCKGLFTLEPPPDNPNFAVPHVVAAEIYSAMRLRLTFDKDLPTNTKGLLLFARRLPFVANDRTTTFSRAEVNLGPQVELGNSRHALKYHFFLWRPAKLLTDCHPSVTIVEDVTHQPHIVEAKVVPSKTDTPRPPDELVTDVQLNLPRALPNGSFSVRVTGLDVLPATASLKIPPVTSDKAHYYFNIQFVFNNEGPNSYAIDAALKPWLFDVGLSWDFEPSLVVSVASTPNTKPDTYHLVAPFNHFWIASHDTHWTFTVSADYLPTKRFTAQQLGGTVSLSPAFDALQRPLSLRLVRRTTAKKPPVWGFTVTPTLAGEAGDNLRSLSPEVQGTAYLRARLSLCGLVEYSDFALSTQLDGRRLFLNEVVLKNDGTVARFTGWKGYMKVQLAWSSYELFKPTLTYELGSQPPNFQRVNNLTFGIAFLY